MKEFIEKLIGRLEEEHERCINRYGVLGGNLPSMEVKQCMEIVNQLAEEYKLFGNSEQVNDASTDLINRSATIDVIWDVFNQYCNDADRFDEYETEAINRAFKLLQSVIEKQPTTNDSWIPCSGCKDCQHKECEHYGKI